MPEAESYSFTHKEIVELLLRKQGITKGIWSIRIEFGLAAMVAGPSDDQLMPTAFVPVMKIGIQKADRETNLAVDASKLPPIEPVKGKRRRK